MKERTQEVNAVMSKDLIQILSQTGQYEDLVNGKIIFQIWRNFFRIHLLVLWFFKKSILIIILSF